jgi:hypothetical protein
MACREQIDMILPTVPTSGPRRLGAKVEGRLDCGAKASRLQWTQSRDTGWGYSVASKQRAGRFPKAPHPTVAVYIEGCNIGSLIVRLFYNRFP